MNYLLVSAVWYLLLWKETNGDQIFGSNPFLHKVITPQIINNGQDLNSLPPGSAGQIYQTQQPEHNVVNIQDILPSAVTQANVDFNYNNPLPQVPQNNYNYANNPLPQVPQNNYNYGNNPLPQVPQNNYNYGNPQSFASYPQEIPNNFVSKPSSSVLPPYIPQTQNGLQLSTPVYPLIIDQNKIRPTSPVFNYVTKPPQPSRPPTPVEFPQIPELPKSPQQSVYSEPEYNLRQLCSQPRGQFPTSKCNNYINCWDEVVLEESCPDGLLFNTAGFCDYPSNVACQGRTVDTSFISSSGKTETPHFEVNSQLKKMCAQSRGLFPSNHCFTFINCWDDNAVEEHCPTNLYFSEKGYCDYPSNVDCNGRLTYENYFQKQPVSETQYNPIVRPPQPANQGQIDSSTQAPIGSDQELNKKCLRINGLFPSHACDKYVNCLNGLAVEQECPPKLLFSENGYCDFAQNVDCKGRKITAGKVSNQHLINQIQGTGTSLQGNLADRCQGQKGQFLTQRCNTYLECWEGSAIERECPPGLFFSQIEGYCDFSHKVDCQNRVVPVLEKKVEQQCIDGTYRNPRNCSQYYVCSGGLVESTHECPSGLRYNQVLGVCDFPSRVECSVDRVNRIDTVQGVPAELAGENLTCIPGRIFRLNLNCTSVAICREEGTEVASCPDGLSYDTPTDRCVYPEYARCFNLKV